MDTGQAAAASAETTAPADAEAEAGSMEPAGHAAFNPFGTVGVGVVVPAPTVSEPPSGDLALPVVATLAGFAVIGWMLRAMLQ